ncbi:hypothetical protein GOP47_0002128 [Adiantum capillus-veneris]|uniref:HTH CENPB-type domain-containing protein n=1 Tax=Adiantum capillus-veneris TaxID=13818 RepID=A0A9D4VAC5_ADICA|nr:hypothetical protein GOP47_0002128 [Adiantum capillus-veneris]
MPKRKQANHTPARSKGSRLHASDLQQHSHITSPQSKCKKKVQFMDESRDNVSPPIRDRHQNFIVQPSARQQHRQYHKPLSTSPKTTNKPTSSASKIKPLLKQAKPNFSKRTSPNTRTSLTNLTKAVQDSACHLPTEGEAELPKTPHKVKKRTVLRWTELDMAKALQAREDGLSLRKCSLQFGISRSAITNWEEGRTQKKKKGPPTQLSNEEEDALLQWIFLKCESGHGVSVLDVKLKVAEICQTRHTMFSNGIPGKSWWEGFRRRHPNLVFRVSEGLDQSRASRFRLEIVKSLHENLLKLYTEHNYPPTNIWNEDETGFQGSRDKGMKVLARKGAKAVYGVTCDSREWMTVLCCVNATGQAIPSYYIFKGSHITSNYIRHCEPGAAMAMQKKAWMTGELFQAWLEHFDNAITQTIGKSSRHLLILDGHGSHVSLDVVEKANAAGIDIITLPAHTSHKLQPLDVSVFKSLKVQFRKERDIWQQKTSSRQATKAELATIVARAIESSFTESNITAGFRATGIWPLNLSTVHFEGMPSKHINIVEDETTEIFREEDNIENLSQVPNTPMQPNIEDEAIIALNNMAAQLDEDILREPGEIATPMTFTQLLQEEDMSIFQGPSQERLYTANDENAGNFNTVTTVMSFAMSSLGLYHFGLHAFVDL